MKTRFTALIILDGWGLNPRKEHNAVVQASTPVVDRITKEYASATIRTSGRNVGLPEGLMGNSEVGHLNLGAGRVVTQAMTKIEDSIADGSFKSNEAILAATNRLKATDGKLHLVGLISDGGVHSWPTHYIGLLQMAAQQGLDPKAVCLHAFLDGRDTPPMSSKDFVANLEAQQQTLALLAHREILPAAIQTTN